MVLKVLVSILPARHLSNRSTRISQLPIAGAKEVAVAEHLYGGTD